MRTPWDLYNEEGQDPIAGLQAGYRPPMAARPLPVIPNVYRGSGQVRSAANDTDTTNGVKKTIQNWASENDMRAENAAVARLPQVQDQAHQLELNRELMRQSMAQPATADLATPLANASDYFQTGQLGNRKPQGLSMQDHAKDIREWAKQNQDDQRDLSKTILSGASAYKSGQTADTYNQILKSKLEEKNQDPAMTRGGAVDQEINNFSKWKRDVNQDKVIKEMPGNLEQLKIARNMLVGNSPVEAQNFKLALLKGLGVNRITDYELRNEQGGMAYLQQLDRALEKGGTGKMEATDRKDYLNLVDGLIARSNSAYTQHYNHHIENGVVNYKIPYQHAVVGINTLSEPTAPGQVPRNRFGKNAGGSPEAPTSGDPMKDMMDAFLKKGG